MFHFPRLPPPAYVFSWGAQVLPERVTPFGNPRLSLLDSSPRLFAVLPRPSSALDAKASTMRLVRSPCFRLDIRPYSVVKVLLDTKTAW